jgi:hypothetical protein
MTSFGSIPGRGLVIATLGIPWCSLGNAAELQHSPQFAVNWAAMSVTLRSGGDIVVGLIGTDFGIKRSDRSTNGALDCQI